MANNQKIHQNNQSRQHVKPQKNQMEKQGRVKADQLRDASQTMQTDDILQAQKTVGNQTVQRSLSGVAAMDQEITDQEGYLEPNISDTIQQSRGGGSSLPSLLKEEGKQKFGREFDDVRVHTDKKADQISKQINAKAFTIGKDIFFREGQFEPQTRSGRETLLHEMTHVAQQDGAASTGSRLKLGAPDTAHEKEAEKSSRSESKSAASQSSQGTVQRNWFTDLFKKKQKVDPEKAQWDERMKVRQMGGVEGAKSPKEFHEQSDVMKQKQSMHSELGAKIKEMGIGSKENLEHLENIPKKETFQDELQAKRTEMGIGSKENLEHLENIPKKETLQDQLKAKREEMGIGSEKNIENLNSIPKKKTMSDELSEQRAKMGIGSKENLNKLGGLDERQEKATKEGYLQEGKERSQENKQKLIAIIKDPTKSEEEVNKAQQQLEDLHGSKTNDFLKIFGKDKKSGLVDDRKSILKNAAKRGDKGAYEKYMAYKKANPSTTDKIGGFFKSTFSSENVKSYATKGLGMLKGLFGGGGGEQEQQQQQQPGGTTINLNGGGGGGMGGGGMATIMQEYARVLEENKKLKEELKAKGD